MCMQAGHTGSGPMGKRKGTLWTTTFDFNFGWILFSSRRRFFSSSSSPHLPLSPALSVVYIAWDECIMTIWKPKPQPVVYKTHTKWISLRQNHKRQRAELILNQKTPKRVNETWITCNQFIFKCEWVKGRKILVMVAMRTKAAEEAGHREIWWLINNCVYFVVEKRHCILVFIDCQLPYFDICLKWKINISSGGCVGVCVCVCDARMRLAV